MKLIPHIWGNLSLCPQDMITHAWLQNKLSLIHFEMIAVCFNIATVFVLQVLWNNKLKLVRAFKLQANFSLSSFHSPPCTTYFNGHLLYARCCWRHPARNHSLVASLQRTLNAVLAIRPSFPFFLEKMILSELGHESGGSYAWHRQSLGHLVSQPWRLWLS